MNIKEQDTKILVARTKKKRRRNSRTQEEDLPSLCFKRGTGKARRSKTENTCCSDTDPCTLQKISHWNHLVQRQRRRGPIRDSIPADHRRHAPRRRHERWQPAPSTSSQALARALYQLSFCIKKKEKKMHVTYIHIYISLLSAQVNQDRTTEVSGSPKMSTDYWLTRHVTADLGHAHARAPEPRTRRGGSPDRPREI